MKRIMEFFTTNSYRLILKMISWSSKPNLGCNEILNDKLITLIFQNVYILSCLPFWYVALIWIVPGITRFESLDIRYIQLPGIHKSLIKENFIHTYITQTIVHFWSDIVHFWSDIWTLCTDIQGGATITHFTDIHNTDHSRFYGVRFEHFAQI